MKVGLQIPHFRPSTPETRRAWLKETAQLAEAGGMYSLWVMDHFFQLGFWLGEPEDEMMEGYATLGYLAGVTKKVKLGLLVGGVIYRYPALSVKTISTLDVLSGGRMYFGIGAAWYEHESKSLGLPFPSTAERFEWLEEQLQIAHQMFRGDSSPYKGKHFELPYPHNNPQPLSKPHPPILIGGMGPQKTLRFVAQYADATNFFGGREEGEIKEKLEILKGHCKDVGRDYDEIEKTVLQTADLENGTEPDPIERAKQLNEWGFSHIIFNIKGEYTPEAVAFFTEKVVPAVKDL
jgi:F420-dependent oxidoreductase-like protein